MNRALLITAAAVMALCFVPAASAGDEAPKVRKAQGYTPVPPKDGYQYPECFCTDSQGERVEIGQTTCLQIGSTQVFARCGMSLNNPTWRRISEGCPTS